MEPPALGNFLLADFRRVAPSLVFIQSNLNMKILWLEGLGVFVGWCVMNFTGRAELRATLGCCLDLSPDLVGCHLLTPV